MNKGAEFDLDTLDAARRREFGVYRSLDSS
jgi:hypothetical protein